MLEFGRMTAEVKARKHEEETSGWGLGEGK